MAKLPIVQTLDDLLFRAVVFVRVLLAALGVTPEALRCDWSAN
jgi:hypothetical protein